LVSGNKKELNARDLFSGFLVTLNSLSFHLSSAFAHTYTYIPIGTGSSPHIAA